MVRYLQFETHIGNTSADIFQLEKSFWHEVAKMVAILFVARHVNVVLAYLSCVG